MVHLEFLDPLFANPLWLHIIVVVVSMAIIVKAAQFLVQGISGYSEKHGLSDYITGMVIIALTASVPELVSSIFGIVAAESGVVFGTIIGSNIAGIALVLGLFALVGRKISLKNKQLEKTEMIIFIFSIIPFLLVADGLLSRIDGLVLVLLYIAFLGVLWKQEKKIGKLKKEIKIKHIWKDALLFILAFAAMLLSARWLVFSAIEGARILGVTPYFVSLVIIGIGATVPDITVGIRSLLAGHKDVGLGGSLGSMMIKSLFFFGVLALIKPLAIQFELILTAVVFTIIIRGIVFYYMEKGYMDWKTGLLLLLMFIAFVVIESIK